MTSYLLLFSLIYGISLGDSLYGSSREKTVRFDGHLVLSTHGRFIGLLWVGILIWTDFSYLLNKLCLRSSVMY